MIAALFQQWMIPSVKNALIPFTVCVFDISFLRRPNYNINNFEFILFQNMDVLKSMERLLKLSVGIVGFQQIKPT